MLCSEHQNWFGIDENLGPVAVSIRRERVPATTDLLTTDTSLTSRPANSDHWMYRSVLKYFCFCLNIFCFCLNIFCFCLCFCLNIFCFSLNIFCVALNIFPLRLIVRTSDLLPLRGTVLEDSIPALKSEKIKTIPTREVLEFCFPELQLSR